MPHRTRSEQKQIARKDPKRLAKPTKAHAPKVQYKRKSSRQLYSEYLDDTND